MPEPLKILLVEDDERSIERLCKFLTQAGFEVLVARTLIEAKKMLLDYWDSLECVLLDYLLVRFVKMRLQFVNETTDKFIRLIKRLKPNLPVIATSSIDAYNKILVSLGADAGINKFNFGQIAQALRTLSDRRD